MTERRVILRGATVEDAAVLWSWRNDPVTRWASRHRDLVAWPDHVAWLSRAIRDPSRALFIGEEEGEAVAVCRLDRRRERDGRDSAEVNLTVAPAWRHRGIGRAILRAVETEARAAVLVRLIAEIRWSNRASLRLFRRAGYHLTGVRWGFVTLTKRLDTWSGHERRP